MDRDCSLVILIRYGLDGLGIESRWGRDFLYPPRPAQGSAQPPIKWVTILFPGGKVRPGRAADHSPPYSAAVMEQ